MNALFLGLQFTSQAVSYLVFVDRAALGSWRAAQARQPDGYVLLLGGIVTAVLGGWHIVARWTEFGSSIAFLPRASVKGLESLTVAVPVCPVVFAALAVDVARGRRIAAVVPGGWDPSKRTIVPRG